LIVIKRGGLDARDAYRQLLILRNSVDDRLSDIAEVDFRTDDEGVQIAMIEWQVGIDYLFGRNGLPSDEHLAKTHLNGALDSNLQLEHNLPELVSQHMPHANADQTSLFRDILQQRETRALINRLERIIRLKDVGAPRHIVQAEHQQFQDALDRFLQSV
jgi:hypothetical protein